MANFKTHISLGVFIGFGFIIAGLIYSFIASPETGAWIFLAVIVGSFLPDLDLDDGIPFQILFGLFGAGIAGLTFFSLYQSGEKDLKTLILIPVLVFTVVRFIGGYVFKKFTHHRGMFHSIPALILSGLLTVWLLRFFSIFNGQELFIGLAIAVGYLGHLILDEIYSSVNLSGYSFLPKKSFGSALKFYSSSGITTLLFYFSIFLLASNLPETKTFLNYIYKII